MTWWQGLRLQTRVTDGTRQYLLCMPPTLFHLIKFTRTSTIAHLHLQTSPHFLLVLDFAAEFDALSTELVLRIVQLMQCVFIQIS